MLMSHEAQPVVEKAMPINPAPQIAVKVVSMAAAPPAGAEVGSMDLAPPVRLAVGSIETVQSADEKVGSMVTAQPAIAVSTDTASQLKIEIISEFQDFLNLEPIWNRLVEQAEIDHPFLRHEWIRTWWESFGNGKKLHILLVKAGGETIAIAPLVLGQKRIYCFKMRQLISMHNDHSPRFDFIVPRWSDKVYDVIWEYLKRQKLWDMVQISQLPTASPTLKEFQRRAVADGLLFGTWPSDNSPYIDFAQGWNTYLAHLSSQHKKKIRQRVRQLEQLGRVELETISSVEKIQAALEDGLRLEAAGWKKRSGTAIRCIPELVRFYSQLASTAAQAGMLRLIFLTVGGTRIAFAYALCYKNKLFVLKAGYDPNYAEYSPYNVLCYLVFQDACARGLAEYEFLGLNDPWKLRWAKETRPHCWLYLFRKSPRTRLVHWAKFRGVPELKRWLFFASRN